MQAGDLKFLEYLEQHEGEILGPAMVAKNTRKTDDGDYNRDYVWRRLQDLVDAGLVDKVGRGEYTITDYGIEYLEGNVPPDELTLDDSAED
jgi:repressor of nif and glnA expression